MSGLAFAIYVVFVAVPARPGATDVDLLQGEWRVVAADTSTPGQEKFFVGGRIAVRGNRIRWFSRDDLGQVPLDSTFVLDPAKAPKTIDFFSEEAEDPKVPMKGIYAIEKDRLRLFWRGTPAPRPTTFERSDNGQGWDEIWLILQRVQKW